ncbi:MAG TPA: hypothetical protein VLE73_01300 [Candidatus Saccharimonadales bacterium]|nr:hypothetical protein [Candidatus Saccharimonadales bacterium]
MTFIKEFSFAANPGWNQLDTWREVLPSGDAVLIDPANGGRLTGPHEWLQADPRLRWGVDFILEHATDINLTVVRGDHGPNSQDSLACEIIADSDVVGIEGLGAWTEDGPGPKRTDDYAVQSKLSVAKKKAIPSFTYDAQANSPIELDRLLCRIGVLWDPRYSEHPDHAKTAGERLEWLVASEALREPYIFANYGYQLQWLWSGLGHTPVAACLTIGRDHENVPKMFEQAGVRVHDIVEPYTPESGADAVMRRIIPKMLATRTIPAAVRTLQ